MANLTDTTSAEVWAEEFCRIFDGRIITSIEGPPGPLADRSIDPGSMLAWFAGAIETGRNAGRKETCPHTTWHTVSEEMKLCTTCGLAAYGEAWGPDHPDYDEMGQ